MSAAVAPFRPQSLAFRVPLLGTMLRDAVFGHPDAKYYFIANIVMLLLWSFIKFGYPAVIIFGLTATATALTMLVVLTSQDIIENIGKPTRRMPPARMGRLK